MKKKIRVSIGGLTFLLHSDNDNLIRLATEKYKDFLTDKKPLLKVFLQLDMKKRIGVLAQKPVTAFVPPEIYREGSGFRIKDKYFRGYFNIKNLEAEVCQYFPTLSFDSFIRIIYSLILSQRDGFLLHACSVAKDGRGYVFSGKSGTGKTTVANLSGDNTVLTDEVSLIRNVRGKYRVFATPFYGEFRKSINMSAAIERLYLLIQDKKTYQRRLASKEAIRRLLPNVLFFAKDSYLTRKLFSICYNFISTVTCYDLHFSLNSPLWRYIDG